MATADWQQAPSALARANSLGAEAVAEHGDKQLEAQVRRGVAHGARHHGGPGEKVPVRHFVEHAERAGEVAAPLVEDEEVVRGEGVGGHAELYALCVEP